MTRYDGPEATDGHGGPHPLRGVPQEALDAAREALKAGTDLGQLSGERIFHEDDLASVAEAVLAAALVAMTPDVNPGEAQRAFIDSVVAVGRAHWGTVGRGAGQSTARRLAAEALIADDGWLSRWPTGHALQGMRCTCGQWEAKLGESITRGFDRHLLEVRDVGTDSAGVPLADDSPGTWERSDYEGGPPDEVRGPCEHPTWTEGGDGHVRTWWTCTECGTTRSIAPWVTG